MANTFYQSSLPQSLLLFQESADKYVSLEACDVTQPLFSHPSSQIGLTQAWVRKRGSA